MPNQEGRRAAQARAEGERDSAKPQVMRAALKKSGVPKWAGRAKREPGRASIKKKARR